MYSNILFALLIVLFSIRCENLILIENANQYQLR